MDERIQDAHTKIFAGIKELKEIFPAKKFTIDGRLVGDIGEVLAETYYDLSLYDKILPYHDGETSDGCKVQIKATFKDSLTFSHVPDYYLGLEFFADGTYEEIFNGPGRVILDFYQHRKGIGTVLLSFPISVLKKLSDSVPDSERIPRRRSIR
ncbi:MAG TPA: hypothetical protein VMW69_14710 [Spirochaetia bacterium]|nr:hypothetical protein [Spirochaetia bacterium]